jgi:predicted nucleic acid-binding protein
MPHVVARLDRIALSPADLFVTCPPQVLELCHSARNLAEHRRAQQAIAYGFPLPNHPDKTTVLAIQQALWAAGKVRAAGPLDILIAAYAVLNDAVVISCDRDFCHLARAYPALRQEYLPPVS